MARREVDLGPVDAYAIAVAEGYTGTREEWVQAMANAEANGLKAEGYAVGEQNGTPVTSGEYFENNAKYYNEQAQSAKEDAETAQTAAETARTAAETAQTAAETAQTAAEAAAARDTAAWLNEHITNPNSPPLDRTLMSSSAAAPADMVGDLKSAFDDFDNLVSNSGLYSQSWQDVGQIIAGSGNYNLAVGIGNQVSNVVNPSPSWGSQILPVEKGDAFKVSGIGGNNPRLWGFTDENYILLAVADAIPEQQTDVRITAPADGYLFVNTQTGSSVVRAILKYITDYSIPVINARLDTLEADETELDTRLATAETTLEAIEDNTIRVYDKNLTNEIVNKWVYNTSIGTGAVVDMEGYSSNQSGSLVVPCKSGDKYCITGTGGGNPRLWCFTDEDYRIISVSEANASAENLEIIAPNDGYLIYQRSSAYPYKIEKLNVITTILDDTLYEYIDIDKTKYLVRGVAYDTNENPGTVVDISGHSSGQFSSIIDACQKNDKYIITGTGGGNPRLWCFSDADYKIISAAGANASAENLEIIAPENGYLIYQVSTAFAYKIEKLNVKTLKTDAKFTEVDDTLYPFTAFNMFRTIAGLGDSYTEGDLVDSSGQYTTVADINYLATIAKRNGISYSNYGSGGSTVETYLTRQAFTRCLTEDAKDCYMICFGLNDADRELAIGTIDDIKDDYMQNPNTYYGNYGKILSQLMSHAPHAKIILIGVWIEQDKYLPYSNAAKAIAEHFGIMYIHPQDDPFFTSRFFIAYLSGGHPTAMHYAGMGLALERLFAKCVVNNPQYFKYALVN